MEVTMPDDMGTFRINIEIENPALPGPRGSLAPIIIDTASALTWLPASVLESLNIKRLKISRFRQADGTIIERWIGSAWVHAAGTLTTDDVVFGEPGDMIILGARTLEGLNLRVDPVAKQLVDAGPAPAAFAS
jgi:predicted aspartyl protease